MTHLDLNNSTNIVRSCQAFTANEPNERPKYLARTCEILDVNTLTPGTAKKEEAATLQDIASRIDIVINDKEKFNYSQLNSVKEMAEHVKNNIKHEKWHVTPIFFLSFGIIPLVKLIKYFYRSKYSLDDRIKTLNKIIAEKTPKSKEQVRTSPDKPGKSVVLAEDALSLPEPLNDKSPKEDASSSIQPKSIQGLESLQANHVSESSEDLMKFANDGDQSSQLKLVEMFNKGLLSSNLEEVLNQKLLEWVPKFTFHLTFIQARDLRRAVYNLFLKNKDLHNYNLQVQYYKLAGKFAFELAEILSKTEERSNSEKITSFYEEAQSHGYWDPKLTLAHRYFLKRMEVRNKQHKIENEANINKRMMTEQEKSIWENLKDSLQDIEFLIVTRAYVLGQPCEEHDKIAVQLDPDTQYRVAHDHLELVNDYLENPALYGSGWMNNINWFIGGFIKWSILAAEKGHIGAKKDLANFYNQYLKAKETYVPIDESFRGTKFWVDYLKTSPYWRQYWLVDSFNDSERLEKVKKIVTEYLQENS